MIILLYLVGILSGLGHCQNEAGSRFEIEKSINRTIDQVERMIEEDPRLPRLSRNEIVDILRNITTEDESISHVDPMIDDKTREDYQRSLMVVLPYSPKNSGENITDLYARPPMTRLLPESVSQSFETISEIVDSKDDYSSNDDPLDNFVASEDVPDSNFGEDDDVDSPSSHQNHRDTYSDVMDPADLKMVSADGKHAIIKNDKTQKIIYAEAPERFSFDLNNLQTPFTTPRPSTTRDDYWVTEVLNDSVATDSKFEAVYDDSSATKRPSSAKINRVESRDRETSTTPSTTGTERVLTFDKWQYNAPPTTTARNQVQSIRAYATSTSRIETVREESNTSPPMRMSMKEFEMSNNWEQKSPPSVSPVYVTPMTVGQGASISANEQTGSFVGMTERPATSAATMGPMRPEVMQLLASIGLSPGDATKSEQKDQVVGSGQSFRPQIMSLDASAVDSPSILSQNTFGIASFDQKAEAQSLTPNMQSLLHAFGLQTSKQVPAPSTTTTRRPPGLVNLNSYSNFKPLPTANVDNTDMRDFLAKFGLGDDDEKNRGQKSIKTRKNAETSVPSIIDAVPDDMKRILQNIGLISRSEKSIEFKSSTAYNPTPTQAPTLHVFKPHETPGHSDEQKRKIEQLLDTVRQVQAGQADSNDVQRAAKDLLESTKTLKNGPDPLRLEEILQIYNEGLKNEVKRQEEIATTTPAEDGTEAPVITEATEDTTTTTTTTTTTSTTMASTTLDARNVEALAESFGGSTQAPDPALPAQRRTGLYFLVDWNTFLEVGEEGKADKINLRFQPKVGDRSRFIPVTVP